MIDMLQNICQKGCEIILLPVVSDYMAAGAPVIRFHVLPHTLGCLPHIVQRWAGVMLSYGGSWSFTALKHWGVKSVT